MLAKIVSSIGFSVILSTVGWSSTPTLDKENRANIAPSSLSTINACDINLLATINRLTKSIQKAHKTANTDLLHKDYTALTSLQSDDKDWRAVAQELKSIQWPSQKNWRDVVISHLFYLPILNLFDFYATRSTTERRDYLWSLAFAANHNHPLAQYFLAQILQVVERRTNVSSPNSQVAETTEKKLSKKNRALESVVGNTPGNFEKVRTNDSKKVTEHRVFYDALYKQAFNDLEQRIDHPEARYIVAINYQGCLDSVPTYYEKDTKKQIELHLTGNDPRNQFAALECKRRNPKTYPAPTADDYLKLARQLKYSPAYLVAAELTQDESKKIKIYNEAIFMDYLPAYIKLGRFYRLKKDLKEAKKNSEETKKNFETAGKKRFAIGYLEAANTIVIDIAIMEQCTRTILSDKSLTNGTTLEVFKNFEEAGKLNNIDSLYGFYKLDCIVRKHVGKIQIDNVIIRLDQEKKSLETLGIMMSQKQKTENIKIINFKIDNLKKLNAFLADDKHAKESLAKAAKLGDPRAFAAYSLRTRKGAIAAFGPPVNSNEFIQSIKDFLMGKEQVH